MNRNILLVFMALVIVIAGAIVSLPENDVQAEPVELPKHLYSKPVKVPYLDFNIDELSIIRKENEDGYGRMEGNNEGTVEDQSDAGVPEQDSDEYSVESVETAEPAEDYCYNDGRNQTEAEGGVNEDEEADPEAEYSELSEETPETEVYVEEGTDDISGSDGSVPSYFGTCTITAYCPCEQCCGSYATGYTASGTIATAGRTVASNVFETGTRLVIGDHEYVVEDTGWTPYGDYWVDIFFDTHEEALAFGVKEMDVYVIEE